MFMTCRACVEKCIRVFRSPLDWGVQSLFKVIKLNSTSCLVGKILSSSSLILTLLLCCYFINIPLTFLANRFNQQSLLVSNLHSFRKNIVGVNIIHIFVECYLNYRFNLQKVIVGVCLTTTHILFY